MRDIKRIKKVCKLLELAWLQVPDWRLGQLVSNLLGPGPQDVFFLEDTSDRAADPSWEKLLRDFINKYGNN